MPTLEVLPKSPTLALAMAVRGGLQAGQAGVVLARPGTGKSPFLVQMALDAMLRGTDVLHVSTHHPQAHVRAYYDELFTELTHAGRNGVRTEEALAIERHRVIHSCLGRAFTAADLKTLMGTLASVMEFHPTLVVVDVVDAAGLDAASWIEVARETSVRLWLAVRTHRDSGPTAEQVAAQFPTAVALEPTGDKVQIRVLRRGGETPSDDPAVTLDPTTLMLQPGASAPSHQVSVSPAASACTLYATGAAGTEAAFGALAEKYGMKEVNFTADGHDQERAQGRTLLGDKELSAGDVSLVYVSRRLHRQWTGDENVRRVLQLLWQVVSHAQHVFVIGSIQEDGTVVGGTGWSVELARRWRKDVWVFDQGDGHWYKWDGSSWKQDVPVISTTRFAGTGTRHLTEAGQRAIEDLFSRSFGG